MEQVNESKYAVSEQEKDRIIRDYFKQFHPAEFGTECCVAFVEEDKEAKRNGQDLEPVLYHLKVSEENTQCFLCFYLAILHAQGLKVASNAQI